MRYLTHLSIFLLFAVLHSSCSSKPSQPTVIHEASDYSPIGEALKFLGLCFLGISVVYAAAAILKQLIGK